MRETVQGQCPRGKVQQDFLLQWPGSTDMILRMQRFITLVWTHIHQGHSLFKFKVEEMICTFTGEPKC